MTSKPVAFLLSDQNPNSSRVRRPARHAPRRQAARNRVAEARNERGRTLPCGTRRFSRDPMTLRVVRG
jgi:hypothetical protein